MLVLPTCSSLEQHEQKKTPKNVTLYSFTESKSREKQTACSCNKFSCQDVHLKGQTPSKQHENATGIRRPLKAGVREKC